MSGHPLLQTVMIGETVTLDKLERTAFEDIVDIPDDDNTFGDLEVVTTDSSQVSERNVKNLLLANSSATVLAEGPFQNGPAARRIWEQAFDGFDRDNRTDDEADITVKYDDNTPGPRDYVSFSIERREVKLQDGTTLDNVFQMYFSRSAGTPSRTYIIQA